MREECKEERQRRIDEASLKLEQLRAPTEIIPCTRAQWAAWLGANIDEMRIRMQKAAAPKRRRDLNIRIDKRPGLPKPAKRIQPQADRSKASTEWGRLLEWRTGWYGIEWRSAAEATSEQRLFYMVCHRSSCFVIDLESHRVPGRYRITGTFRITDNMMSLAEFERKFSSNDVNTVYTLYKFDVEGSSPAPGDHTASGIILSSDLCGH